MDGEARFASVCFFASSFRVKFRAPRQLTLVFVRTFVTSFRDVDTTSNPLCNSPPFRAAGGIRGAFITQSAHAAGCGFRVFLRDGLSFFSAFGSSFCGLCALLHRNVLQRLILPGLVPGVITDVVVVTARCAEVDRNGRGRASRHCGAQQQSRAAALGQGGATLSGRS